MPALLYSLLYRLLFWVEVIVFLHLFLTRSNLLLLALVFVCLCAVSFCVFLIIAGLNCWCWLVSSEMLNNALLTYNSSLIIEKLLISGSSAAGVNSTLTFIRNTPGRFQTFSRFCGNKWLVSSSVKSCPHIYRSCCMSPMWNCAMRFWRVMNLSPLLVGYNLPRLLPVWTITIDTQAKPKLETVSIAERLQNRQHARKTPNAVNTRMEGERVEGREGGQGRRVRAGTVSYTHLTLPTIYSV